MALRQQLKVPQYGLFYFECDKTTSIVPTNKITKVLSGDKKSKGSLVEVDYAGVILKAEIIGANDDQKVLNRLDVEFFADPKNVHRFPRPDEAMESVDSEEDLETAPPKKKKRALTKPGEKSKKKATKGRALSGKNKPKAPVKQNVKELATVIAIYSPAKENTPTPEPHPSMNRTFASSVTSLTYAPSHSVHTSLLNSSPDYMYSSLTCSLSIAATSTPRIRRNLFEPGLFNHEERSDTVEMLRRIQDVERKLYRVDELERKVDQLLDMLTESRQPLRQPEPHVQRESEPPLDNSVWNLATLDNSVWNLATPLPPARPDSTDTEDFVTPVNAPTANGIEKTASIPTIRAQSSSSMNFAVRLMRRDFTRVELIGKNVNGRRGKDGLDPERINGIRQLVHQYYPIPPSERLRQWSDCVKAMDSFLRKMKPLV